MSAVPQLYQKIFQPISSEFKNHENSPHQCWGASGIGSHPLSLWGWGLVMNLDLIKPFSSQNANAIVQGQTKADSGPNLRTLRVNP